MGNIKWLIGIIALNWIEETNQKRPTQQRTVRTGDNPKGKQVQFHSAKLLNFKKDLCLKTRRIESDYHI